MFFVDEIFFAVALASGACLVLGAALGFVDAGASSDTEFGSADCEVSASAAAEPDGVETDPASLLGFGRVPLFFVALIFSLVFGVVGFSLAPACRWLLSGPLVPLTSLSSSSVTAWFVTRLSTRLLGRWLPTTESYASRKGELVGACATVVVSTRRGEAILRATDRGGAELHLVGNVGDRDFRPGQRLCLISYDRTSDRFEIEPLDI